MTPRDHARTVAIAVGASLVLGGATSYAQGLLPDALSSLANSVSGWTIVTALVIAALRPTWRVGALLGPVSFVCLVLGYTVASHLRGFAYDPLLWSVVGILGGPFVGAAAASCMGADRRAAALGSGVLAGVLVADGVYGLTVVGDTTSPVYWTVVLVLAVVLLAWVARRLGGGRLLGVQLGTAVLFFAAGTAAFAVLNSSTVVGVVGIEPTTSAL